MDGSAFQNEAVPALKGEAVFQDALRRNTAMKKIGGIALFLNLFQRAACAVFARQLARPAYSIEKEAVQHAHVQRLAETPGSGDERYFCPVFPLFPDKKCLFRHYGDAFLLMKRILYDTMHIRTWNESIWEW